MDFTEDNAAELGETLGLMGFLHSSVGKESACNAGDPASIPGSGRSPGEGDATCSSILAWKIPWTEDSSGLQSLGTQKSRTQLRD